MKRTVLTLCFMMAPVLAQGATYYVAKTGNDLYSCSQAQSLATPKVTIAGGISCLSSGDTLIIKGGTYTEGIPPGKIPSGRSLSAQTTLKAATGEAVIINGSNSIGDALSIYDRTYIVIDGLRFDGHRIRIGGNGPRYSHHITIRNSTIANTISANYSRMSQSCVTQQGPGGANSHIYFINNVVYNCGPDTGHGIYLSARDSLIEGNRVYKNAKFGIHVYSRFGLVNNNIIRYNEIYQNGAFGILVGSGANNKVYSNTVKDNGGGGIEIGFNKPLNNEVYRNEIYENNGYCIRIKRDVYSSRVQENICLGNRGNTVLDEGIGTEKSVNVQ